MRAAFEVPALTTAILFKIFLVLGAALAIQSIAALVDGYRFLTFARRRRAAPAGQYTPRAAVIVPCKGFDASWDANVRALLGQDYPSYQLVFVVASRNDPAFAHLNEIACRSADRPETVVVVAGYAEGRGEKVNNLLRGLEAVDTAAEILVFADIDARPGRDWLRSLIAPLEDAKVTVSTGFRWYLPGSGFASRLRAAWDTSIATLLGDHDHNFTWGGSTAIRAADFRRLEVAEKYWSHTVSDDYAITRAVRDAGGRIRFEPRCLLASREDSQFGDFLSWANRQIIITRVYAPRLWWLGTAAHTLYAVTILLGLGLLIAPEVATAARWTAAGLLVAVQLLGMAKGGLRSSVARELFPEEGETLQRSGSCYWRLAPLVPWVMLYNFIVASFVRRIEWSGTEYELRSAKEVKVIRRSEV